MEIVRIFTEHLMAFRYGTDQPDEFSRLFHQWQNPDFLYTFFAEHIDDLRSGFFGPISLQAATKRTRDEAKRLERILQELAVGLHSNLDSVFEPLQLQEPITLGRSKVTGDHPRSWLRLYAIKLEPKVYIVTGGAIKLTRAMQDREHTRQELSKLNRCRDYLREQGITEIDGLSELIV